MRLFRICKLKHLLLAILRLVYHKVKVRVYGGCINLESSFLVKAINVIFVFNEFDVIL
jgi:hypothetical protein